MLVSLRWNARTPFSAASPQFVVRWSVFLLGPAGCGKSAIWRTLMKAQNNAGEKTVYRPINPKAVTRNELDGFLHPQVRAVRSYVLCRAAQ